MPPFEFGGEIRQRSKRKLFSGIWDVKVVLIYTSSDSFETGTLGFFFFNSYFTIKDNSESTRVTSQSSLLESKPQNIAVEKWRWADLLAAAMTETLCPSHPPQCGLHADTRRGP